MKVEKTITLPCKDGFGEILIEAQFYSFDEVIDIQTVTAIDKDEDGTPRHFSTNTADAFLEIPGVLECLQRPELWKEEIMQAERKERDELHRNLFGGMNPAKVVTIYEPAKSYWV